MTTDKGLQVWLPLTDANHCENQGLVGKLTCTTTPTFVDGGKLGKCLSTGAYQMSAEQTAKVFNNNHLTIAFWVYIDAATGASTPRSVFIGKERMGANDNRKFMIMQYPTVNDLHYNWMNDASSKFFINNTIKDALPSYKWTHVAITYENPTAIIYINGVEVIRNTGVSNSSTFAYTTPIIGNNAGRRINDFRIYSYALSPQEIKELSRGKIGHWLGDGNGTSKTFLSDISGFGRHGQVVGNVTLAGDTPRYDKSLKYNGGNVVVTGLPTMSTYTISWWDKFPAGTNLLFDWRLGPVNTSMNLSSAGALIDNNTCYFKIGGIDTGYQNYSKYNITANTWYHCCLVCDDSKSRLYINGIQKWEASKGSIADFSQLILGGRNEAANDGFQYTGQHSDFRIYATALSADDVKELYSLGH